MICVNLWGLIPACEKNLSGTLKKLRENGADAVEGLLVPIKRDPSARGAVTSECGFGELYAESARLGLKIPSVHVFYKVRGRFMPKPSVIRSIRTLSREYGVETFAFSGAFRDKAGAEKWAAYLESIAQALQGENCRILYHNHDQELTKIQVNGEEMFALDHFMRRTSDNIMLQMDIGWAGMGTDEVALAKKYAGRIDSIHLKDFVPGSRGHFHNPDVPAKQFCAIGEGEIRTAEVLNMRHTFPSFSGMIVIDQDFSSGDLLEDIRLGIQNTKAILKETSRPLTR